MDIEPTAANKKKFLIIAVSVAITLFVGFLFYQNRNTEPFGNFEGLNISPPKELTEEEKLLKVQSEELDRLREQYQGQIVPPATTTVQDQVKSVDTLRKQVLKQKTTTTAPKKTVEQQSQELDALRAAANK